MLAPVDIERTMEFILDAQARAEVRMERAEVRMEKTDKRLDGITKLLQQGMRILIKTNIGLAELRTNVAQLAVAQKRTDARVADLAQAQKATERSLKAFIDSMRHGRNGR